MYPGVTAVVDTQCGENVLKTSRLHKRDEVLDELTVAFCCFGDASHPTESPSTKNHVIPRLLILAVFASDSPRVFARTKWSHNQCFVA